jgi:hypothetical protein
LALVPRKPLVERPTSETSFVTEKSTSVSYRNQEDMLFSIPLEKKARLVYVSLSQPRRICSYDELRADFATHHGGIF